MKDRKDVRMLELTPTLCDPYSVEAGQGTMAEFDVFLSLNSNDKPAVHELVWLLKRRRTRV